MKDGAHSRARPSSFSAFMTNQTQAVAALPGDAGLAATLERYRAAAPAE